MHPLEVIAAVLPTAFHQRERGVFPFVLANLTFMKRGGDGVAVRIVLQLPYHTLAVAHVRSEKR